MECIRILHPHKYNERERKFTRPAFRNSPEDGTLSLVDYNCIQGHGRSVADHIRVHYAKYPGVAWNPPIFWKFDTATEFPPGHTIEPDDTGGDDCHQLIKGLDDETLWKVFERHDLPEFSVCNNGGFDVLTEAVLLRQKVEYKQHLKELKKQRDNTKTEGS